MYNLHIVDSYKIWSVEKMKDEIDYAIKNQLGFEHIKVEFVLGRSYNSLCFEWLLHNIVYYITLPFCKIGYMKNINLRCKDVDLQEW